MENLVIHGTKKTPEVFCDASKGIIDFKGRSIPENTYEFYLPIMSWIDKYIASPAEQTIVNIRLDYFNTTSSKSIFDLFKELESLAKLNSKVIVNWYYEEDDDDMFDAGKNIESLLYLPFNMIQVPAEH